MNRTVTATGMEVKATASDSLVISNELKVGTAITHAFSTAASTLVPATHADTYVASQGAAAVATTNGLKFNNNPAVVNASTGVAELTKTLYYGDAVNGTYTYYVDYVVYIASAGQQMSNTDLEVYLYRTEALEKDTQRAVSVDFWVETEADSGTATYADTLNLSTLSKNANNEWASGTITLDVDTIPMNNTDSDWLKVIMRVYFDGALVGTRYNKTTTAYDSSKTYYTFSAANGFEEVVSSSAGDIANYYEADASKVLVYTDAVSTDNVSFNVSFTAVAG